MQNQQYRPPTQQQQRMQNASPSPFGQQQQGNFGSQMSPGTQQNMNQATSMPQQMSGLSQQFGGMGGNMQGMPSAMSGQQANSMANLAQNNAQKAYQMKLMQHQQQLRASGMIPPRSVGGQQSQMFNAAGQQQMAGQMANGQAGGQMNMANQQPHIRKQQFLKTIQGHAQQQGRQFNPAPSINGRIVDLYQLWTITAGAGGSSIVDRNNQWQIVANKMGFTQPQFPTAAEELKQLHQINIVQYERLWYAMRAHQKQEQARVHAHQMAGLGGPTQGSPTKAMQPPNQQNQYSQFQQGQQGQQQQSQATPVQANAQLPQNGMTTPQQQMMQHRRSSSLRKPEQMTPQAANPSMVAQSPHSSGKTAQRSPSIKQETSTAVMKNEAPQSPNYVPAARSIEHDGDYDIPALFDLGTAISLAMPNVPQVQEMGVIDTRAITLSLASGIHSEVRYALDTLAVLTRDERVPLDLEKCEDLLDVIVDCAEEQIDLLSEEAAEVSDALDLAPYEDVIRASRAEAETLQEVPGFGTQAYELDRAADKLIAITTILRNFSFYEFNHRLLTSSTLIKWLSNAIRLLGTRNMLLRNFYNTQDFYKDMIIFLSNTTQSLELPSRDDALHILHFLLAFAPQPPPSYADTPADGKIRFTTFVPSVHRYLPPAVDCLAKLLARADPNRTFYRSIFTASSSSLAISESPLDLLTRAFALAISVLPDRSNRALGNNAQLRIVEARKAYLTQGMLAADILTSLAPSNDTDLARAWIESEDGWAVGLLHLAAVLSVDRQQPPQAAKPRELGHDTESFRLITYRALTMMKRLAEKAGKGSLLTRQPSDAVNGDVSASGDGEGERALKWEGIPQGHAILGAMMMPNTDKVALGLLCGLHEMAMQT